MRSTGLKPGTKVYHRECGITKYIRQDGSIRSIIERPFAIRPTELDDEEDEENYWREVSVRTADLIKESELDGEMLQRAEEKTAKLKADFESKQAQQREWEIWKASLPELPTLVHNHLRECCKDGMMAFLTFLHNDPDALNKLKQNALYLLREEMPKIEQQVPNLEQELNTKKAFLAMVQSTKKQKKGPKLTQTA